METAEPKTKKTHKMLFILAAIGALILIVAAIVAVLLIKSTPTGPFSRSIHKQVSFELYYPANTATKDWNIVASSISATNQAVTYEVGGGGKRFVVSVQSIPSDFDFADFKKKFFATDEFTTNIGTALVGEVGSSMVGSIRTNDGSWVLINTSYTTTQAELSEFVRAFKLAE